MNYPTTPIQHLNEADKNVEFFDYLKTNAKDYRGWCIVVMFYSALHYVDAFFLQENGYRPSKHHERQRRVASSFEKISGHYEKLFSYSVLARYYCWNFDPEEVKHCETALNAIKRKILPSLEFLRPSKKTKKKK